VSLAGALGDSAHTILGTDLRSVACSNLNSLGRVGARSVSHSLDLANLPPVISFTSCTIFRAGCSSL